MDKTHACVIPELTGLRPRHGSRAAVAQQRIRPFLQRSHRLAFAAVHVSLGFPDRPRQSPTASRPGRAGAYTHDARDYGAGSPGFRGASRQLRHSSSTEIHSHLEP